MEHPRYPPSSPGCRTTGWKTRLRFSASSPDQLLQEGLRRQDIRRLLVAPYLPLDRQRIGISELLQLFDDHWKVHPPLPDRDLFAERFRVRGIQPVLGVNPLYIRTQDVHGVRRVGLP